MPQDREPHLRIRPSPGSPIGQKQENKELKLKNDGLKLRNQELEQIALTDQLTGLHNRHYLEEQMPKIQQLKSLTAIMFDADNFKTINDQYGHDAGDVILRKMGHCIQDNLHATDIVIRWGGDEILALLPNISEDNDVSKISYRLYETFQEQHLHISFGIFTAVNNSPNQNLNLTEIINNADKQLKAMKKYKNQS
jgi:diguanylate cyclase (GGDEF)-like protein